MRSKSLESQDGEYLPILPRHAEGSEASTHRHSLVGAASLQGRDGSHTRPDDGVSAGAVPNENPLSLITGRCDCVLTLLSASLIAF